MLLNIQLLKAEYLHIVNADYSQFPLAKIEFFAIDNSGLNTSDFQSSALNIYENRTLVNIENINISSEQSKIPLSVIFLIDNSLSMQGNQYGIAIRSAELFMEYIKDVEFEAALLGFNSNISVIQDLTDNSENFFANSENAVFKESADFNNAFLNPDFSVFDVLKDAKYKPIIILITNNNFTANENLIIAEAVKSNTQIYTLSLNNQTSPSLKNISSISGGKFFEYLSGSEEVLSSISAVYNYANNSKPHSATWLSPICENNRHIEITLNDYLPSSLLSFTPNQLITNLSVQPAYTHDFGIVEGGSNESVSFEIRAINHDIIINSVSSSNGLFQIVNPVSNYLLAVGDTYTMNISFSVSNSKRQFGEIYINSGACLNNTIYLVANSENVNDNNDLKIVYPNGSESFVSQSSQSIEWEGVLPTDNVVLDFSTDAGQSWINVQDSSSGLSTRWFIPNVVSDKCLMRVRHISKFITDDRITILQGHIGDVRQVLWDSESQKLLSYAKDNAIIIWDYNTAQLDLTVRTEESEIYSLSFSPDSRFLSYTKSDSSAIIYDLVSLQIRGEIKQANEKFIKADWTKSGSHILLLSTTGKVYIYNSESFSLYKVVTVSENPITDMQFSTNGLYVAFADESGYIMLWKTADFNFLRSFRNSIQKINSISWNPASTSIAVASQSPEIKIWDALQGNQITSFTNSNTNQKIVRWSPAGKYIATAAQDSIVKLFSPATGSNFYEYPYHKSQVTAVNFNSTGDLIASADQNGAIHIWSPADVPFINKVLQEDISDDFWSIVNPQLTFNSIDFGTTRVNQPKDSLIAPFVINTSSATITIDTITITGLGASVFSIKHPRYPLSITPDEILNLQIRLLGSEAGMYNGEINIFAHLRRIRIPILGSINNDMLSLSANFIDFGSLPIGLTKDTVLTITNKSSQTITIDNISAKGPDIEQFRVIHDFPFQLGAGASEEINLQLNGINAGRTSTTFEIKYNNLPNAYYTSSLALILEPPDINLPSEIDFHIELCNNSPLRRLITLENKNDYPIKINSIVLNDIDISAFAISTSNLPQTLEPSDELTFSIDFFTSLLIQQVNIIEVEISYFNSVIVKLQSSLTGTRDILKYEFDKDILTFNVDEVNTPQTLPVEIFNTGNHSLTLSVPTATALFKCEEQQAIEIPAGSSKVVDITFLGSPSEGTFNHTFEFTDNCSSIYSLILSAQVGTSRAIIDTDVLFIFDEVVCPKSFIDTTITISNTGINDLIISKFEITGENSESFLILLNEEIVIESSTSFNLPIRFQPQNIGINSAELLIYSNAFNSTDGINSVELLGEYLSSDISVEQYVIVMDNILINFTSSYELDITNTGNLAGNYTIMGGDANFSISPAQYSNIQPQAQFKAEIIFNGVSQEGTYSTILIISDECGTVREIDATAIVGGYAHSGLRAGNISAKPGDTVFVPIYLYSPQDIALPQVASYSTTLKYNATLLVPLPPTPIGQYINGYREIDLLNIPANQTAGILAEYKFLATLGNSASAELLLENSYANDNPEIYVESTAGLFNLDELCEEGETRLIDNSGIIRLYSAEPNPADEETIIRYSLIENGTYTLSLYDNNSRLVEVISSGEKNAGDYDITLNTKALSIGIYYYVLQTPSHYLMRKLTIIR